MVLIVTNKYGNCHVCGVILKDVGHYELIYLRQKRQLCGRCMAKIWHSINKENDTNGMS